MIAEENLSIHDLVRSISNELQKKYKNQTLCIQYAWWVLEAITQKKKTDLLLHHSILLTSHQKEQLRQWVTQQVDDSIPLAYLIGSVPFGDCTILVEPPIIIPRLETETWCLELITRLHNISDQSFTILDLCTGSGCIAIALAKAFPKATIYATDISEDALGLAYKNAEHNNVNNITFLPSDLFTDIPNDLHFDMIISNPPYISFKEWQTVDPSVREWEDDAAHLAAEDGTAILKQVIKDAANYLIPHPEFIAHHIPQLVVEIGHRHAEVVESLFRTAGFCDIVIEKDLQGNDRIVSGCISNEAHTNP